MASVWRTHSSLTCCLLIHSFILRRSDQRSTVDVRITFAARRGSQMFYIPGVRLKWLWIHKDFTWFVFTTKHSPWPGWSVCQPPCLRSTVLADHVSWIQRIRIIRECDQRLTTADLLQQMFSLGLTFIFRWECSFSVRFQFHWAVWGHIIFRETCFAPPRSGSQGLRESLPLLQQLPSMWRISRFLWGRDLDLMLFVLKRKLTWIQHLNWATFDNKVQEMISPAQCLPTGISLMSHLRIKESDLNWDYCQSVQQLVFPPSIIKSDTCNPR